MIATRRRASVAGSMARSVDNRFAFDFPEGVDAAGGEPGGVVFQIAPIGVGRIARKTAFNGEVAEKIGEIPFEHDCRRPFWMLY